MALPSRIQPFTKESIRTWLIQRWQRPVPLPDLQQIRRELGWEGSGQSNVLFKQKRRVDAARG